MNGQLIALLNQYSSKSAQDDDASGIMIGGIAVILAAIIIAAIL